MDKHRKYYKSDNRKAFYKTRAAEQQGACAICGKQDRLVIDHDHKTGLMRGLLCYKHNTALGLFEDSITLLQSARTYLELHTPVAYEFSQVPTTKYQKYLAAQDLLPKLLADTAFPSDRARARVLAATLDCKENTANTWVARARKKQTSVTDGS